MALLRLVPASQPGVAHENVAVGNCRDLDGERTSL